MSKYLDVPSNIAICNKCVNEVYAEFLHVKASLDRIDFTRADESIYSNHAAITDLMGVITKIHRHEAISLKNTLVKIDLKDFYSKRIIYFISKGYYLKFAEDGDHYRFVGLFNRSNSD